MGLLKIGQLKKNSYFPLILSYFLILEASSIKDINATYTSHVIVIAIFQSLSSVYSGIFEIIIRYRLNYRINKYSIPKSVNKRKQSLLFLVVLFLLISILDAVTNFMFVYRTYMIQGVPNPPYIENGTKGILIFASCLCCYFILSYKLEVYQICALGIITFAFILNGLMSLANGDDFEIEIFVIELAINSLTAFQEVIEKYLMHFMYQSPFMILFIEGLLDVSFLTVSFFVLKDDMNIGEWFTNNLFHNIIFSIVCVGYNCYRIKINRDSTPTHRVIADSFFSLILHIISMLSSRKLTLGSFGYLFGYTTVVFGCCIYNEIIVLNFCNLNRNTVKEVSLRSIRESNIDDINLNDNDDDVVNISLV